VINLTWRRKVYLNKGGAIIAILKKSVPVEKIKFLK